MNTLIKAGLTGVIALSSLSVHAEFISANDWWLTTDNLGGLRQSTTNPDYYFAVSKDTIWDPTATYGNLDGYRIATTEEGQSVFYDNTPYGNSGHYTYYGQGGWNGYNWEGKQRFFFRFADSAATQAYKHAGNWDETETHLTTNTNYHAGFVMIRDENARASNVEFSDVSAPAAAFGAGLGLLMMGLRRRKG